MKFNYAEIDAEIINEVGRIYKTPGGPMPSITTVLGATTSADKKASLESWRARVGHEEADKITKNAAARGTAIHSLIEQRLLGKAVDVSNIDADTLSMFNSIKPLVNKIEEIWGLEIPLYSNLLEVAGRTDCVGIYAGKPMIIDFKTSRRTKTRDEIGDYFLQLVFYAASHNEMFGTDIDDGVILMGTDGGQPLEFKVKISEKIDELHNRVNMFYNQLL